MLAIPKISDQRLAELAPRIRPVTIRDGTFWFIKPYDPRKTAFSWKPTLDVPAGPLTALRRVGTMHSFSFYGFFKPSVAEVLAQIPEDLIEQAIAFHTVGPRDAEELNQQMEHINAGFHLAQTTFFRRGP